MSRSRTHPSANATALRFRTDADGNIPLACDWFGLLTASRRLGRVVLQTRNAYVRLITLDSAPELAWSSGRGLARDDRSHLTLRPGRWRQARARLAHCTCCGSAGNIRFFDSLGIECLQLCAHPDTEPAEWAGLLAPFTAPLNATPRPLPAGLFCNGTGYTAGPETSLHDPRLIIAFLELFAAKNAPLRCTLSTPGAVQSRDLVPLRRSCLHGLLTVTDGITTLQITLPALRHIAVRPDRIDLGGIDGTSLLVFSPAGDTDAARLWLVFMETALSRS
jgi:hypothetical protein